MTAGTTQEDGAPQLAWEARAGKVAAAAAFAAALLPLIGSLVYFGALGNEGEGTARIVLGTDANPAGVLLSAAISTVGLLVLPVALLYLLRATAARRPETPSLARPLAIGAPVLVAVALVLGRVLEIDASGGFAASEDTSEEAATDRLSDGGVQTVALLRLGLNAVLGIAVILLSLNAMRAGLLSRFMGIIGIAVGAFYIVPLLVNPVLIQLFWFIALGLLFLDRWPGGRGPAWGRVEALPWPSAADRAEEQRSERVSKAQREADESATAADAEGEEERPRPASRKKKRRGR